MTLQVSSGGSSKPVYILSEGESEWQALRASEGASGEKQRKPAHASSSRSRLVVVYLVVWFAFLSVVRGVLGSGWLARATRAL